MQKTLSVADLKTDQKISQVPFALKELELKTSQQNRPYYNVLLADKTGEVRARIFPENFSAVDTNAKAGQIVVINGSVGEYLGKLQIVIESMQIATGMAPEEFLPITSRNRSEMMEDLMNEIQKVQNPHLKTLLEAFWQNQANRDMFSNYPAAEMVHHAYIGGLLEHTWEMYVLSKPFIKLYPQLDWDLLFTGLILHDIGKLEELEIVGATIIRNTAGKLIAHISQGLLMVDRIVSGLPEFPLDLKNKLYHLILSHQGKLEFGSPIQPQTLEAMVLSFVDINSAELNQAAKHIERNLFTGEEFTERHKWLGRGFYQKDFLKSS